MFSDLLLTLILCQRCPSTANRNVRDGVSLPCQVLRCRGHIDWANAIKVYYFGVSSENVRRNDVTSYCLFTKKCVTNLTRVLW
jgi:hypothetical protein